jgi:hypothetical protein
MTADISIKHEFICIDEGHATLLHVDERDQSKNWLVPIGRPQARDMQLIGGNKILIGHHHGYTEFDLALGRVLKEFAALEGVTAVRRQPNGHTIIAGMDIAGTKGVVVLELDSGDKEIHRARFPGDYVRLIRQTEQGTYLMSCNDRIREGSRDGTYLREFPVEGFYHAWKSLRLPNGNLIVTAGYGAFVVELDSTGKVLRKFGGKEQLPENVRPFFYAMFQLLPNGNLVLANWQGHGPGFGSSGVQLLELNGAGELAWSWSRSELISSLQGVLILDGLDTAQLHDERGGLMQPLGRESSLQGNQTEDFFSTASAKLTDRHKPMKSLFAKSLIVVFIVTLVCAGLADEVGSSGPGGSFIHPGLLHSAADIERMKTEIAAGVEPWASAWKAFTNQNRWIAPNYTPRPLEVVGRGVGSTGMANISGDCTAAYYNAIAWAITGEERYAKKSVEIMNAWSYKCKEINGKDAVLCAGIYGYKLVNAAEIIRSTYPAWSEEDIAQFKILARDVFYPVIKDFATFANGNWDASAEAAMISMGVFLDDRAMFDRAVRYYLAGSGDGSVLHYVINETGQLQETGRDQNHSQLGIGLLSCVAEIAWHQGVDLYGAYDNRLLKGFEYTAKYNLGEDVPFVPTSDRTGKYVHQHASVRGEPRVQIWEMVYNHYAKRRGILAPYTERAAEAHRPESPAVDQVGGGTLLFSLPLYKAEKSSVPPAIPGPIVAQASDRGIALRWAGSVGASSYIIERSTASSGPFVVIAKGLTNVTYTDIAASEGKVYYYTVSAVNALGSSRDTVPVGVSEGLPKPWSQQDIGNPETKGNSQFDGSIFTIEGAGKDIGGRFDQLQFAHASLGKNSSIVARYVPPTPSQFAKLGLVIRDSTKPDAQEVAILITPQPTDDIEVPHWHVEFVARPVAGGEALSVAESPALPAPTVTWGRLMAPLWLRLQRNGNTFTAASSLDGETWTDRGSTNLVMNSQVIAGLAACSRIRGSTTVMFDHVNVSSSDDGAAQQITALSPIR